MLRALTQLFSTDIAIDLGTANTLIFARNLGIVLDEPSVVVVKRGGAFNQKASIVAVGHEAKAMLGRVPTNLEAIRPMKDGVIADFTITEIMLKEFIKKIHGPSILRPKPRIVICVPSGSTQVERRAIRECALGAGATQVYLIEEPMAAALGAGMPVSEPAGSMVVDIGGGTTEIGIISLGGMVYKNSVRIGGDKFYEAIVTFIRRNYGMLIGDQTAEMLKKTIAIAYRDCEISETEVVGRNLGQGIPQAFTVSSLELLEALFDPLNGMITAIKLALEQTPPELSSDIADKGVILTGGGALLRGLDQFIREETGLPVLVANDPLSCVVKGCGLALDRLSMSSIFSYE